jgi:hypothetical protein
MPCGCASCPFFMTASCNYADPSECDLVSILAAPEKPCYRKSLLYMKFSYLDEWRHLPGDEFYAIATADDFERAVHAFRERHGSPGTLMVFATEDLIEWWVWGYVPVGETCKG